MKKKVIIIGAGPYGISLAYELWRKDISFEIIGQPFDLWMKHTMPKMAIRSDRHSSEIYSKDKAFDLTKFIYRHEPKQAKKILKDRLPSELYRDYLRDVLEKLPFPIKKEKVVDVQKTTRSFVCRTESGELLESHSVIVATGIENHKVVPDNLKNNVPVIHSWDVGDHLSVEAKDILLIGGGQSAAEAAEHFSKTNRVTWVMRKSPIFYSEPINLPKPLFKAALLLSPYFYFLPKVFKKSLGRKFVETTITPDMMKVLSKDNVTLLCSEAEALDLSSESTQAYSRTLQTKFDLILAATGYRYDLENLSFLGEEIRKNVDTNDGIPAINYNFESSLPGLYFVGGIVEPSYGPAQRFLMGARHVTHRLGKVL
ncbi:NAD(P)-binding domain-containing protein [Alkalicoccus saliphilus]|uniref:NAD(P)-binding domain-containing protein n=1 Tax=Alkalicoccus saliphilus TaxID=200989 RepID=UPI001359EB2E|nr:NAD(P)-binding domain-containing protein [Alkalicoccus saliphilus]